MQLRIELLLIVPVISLAAATPNRVAPRSFGDTTFNGKKVQLKEAPRTQVTAHDPAHLVGDAIKIDGSSFPASAKDGQLRISTAPDGTPSYGVTAVSIPTLSWSHDGVKREVQLGFAQDEKGTWKYHAANAWEYKIGGEVFRLIDSDADGHFDKYGEDGCTTYDSGLMLPLAKEFVLGSNLVQIPSIAPDGSSIVASVSPVKANPSELAALVKLNRWRSANGLSSVSFDPTLCRNCTAHAAYLRLHHWSGNTNPHSEDVGAEGTTPGGRSAAERSVICRGAVAVTLEEFLTTYYHRAPLMSPALEHIGLNEKPDDFTVLDVSDGLDKPWPTAAGWASPAATPAPGSRGVTLSAMTEQPHEPVSDLGSRGLPLMLLFASKEKEVKNFTGKLFERKGTKETEVPALVADPWDFPFIQGIIPSGKLKAKTRYRAVFTWSLRGENGTKVVDFDTQ